MNTKTLISLFICFQLLTGLADLLSAQEFIHQVNYYGKEEGLSHRDVQCIHQDRHGLMWFGTRYGLNRFDGYGFKWYTKEKNGLQSNEINHIVEDDEGLMWLFFTTNQLFQTPIGIDLFNPTTEEILSFEEKFGDSLPFDYRDISSFTASEKGQIAFVTKKNKFILYSSQAGFEVFDLDLHSVSLSCFSKHNTVWGILTMRESFNREVTAEINLEIDSLLRDVIVEIGLDGKLLNRYEHGNLFQKNFIAGTDQSDMLWYISKSAKSNLNRGTDYKKGKIFRIDPAGNETEFLLDQITSPPDVVNLDIPVYANSYGFWVNPNQKSFWLWSAFNFQVFHAESGWYQELSTDDKWLKNTNTVYFDNNDRTWIGTEFGLFVVDHTPSPFLKISHKEEETTFQPFRGITEDAQNNFWACTDRGGAFLLHIVTNENQYNYEFFIKEWSFGYRYGIFTDDNGFLWFGTGEFEIITRYDAKTDSAQFFPYSIPRKIVDRQVNIWSFYQDHKDRIWFGTDVGVIGYIHDNQSVVTLSELEGVNSSGGCIYQFLEDKNGTTWVTTDKGLFILDTENEKISPFSANEISKGLPFFEAGIFHIYEDADGSFWMGTRGMGLIHWHPMTENFEQFTKADGLSDNTIYAVYEDDFENLWMSSDYGIIQFNKNTHRTNTYLTEDGITHNEFNRMSHYKSQDGAFFFGGLNGITVFHPKDLVIDTAQNDIPLVLTKFQQFDGSQNQLIDKTTKLQESATIILAPDDRFFRLEFALLAYLNLENVQYAYKVEGVDRDWNYQKENSLRFSRLPYGKHVLRIKGQASDGQWSNRELQIKVLVLSPFYLRTWFLALSVFSFFASLFLFFKWRTARLIKQKTELEQQVADRTKTIRQQTEELKSLERLKSRFFANVSHELRTPLTLMLGPTKTLLKEAKENTRNKRLLQFINRNGKQLLKLINEILDLSKLESGKLKLQEEPIHLHGFLENLLAQFYSFGASEGVELSVDYQGDERLQVLLDKGKVEKIIQNFLSNALKFTPAAGRVSMLIEETDYEVCISVQDTGEGIHSKDLPFIFDRFYQSKHDKGLAQGGTGIGLSLCRELAELLGGTVWAESELGIGSIFYFKFPKKTVVGSQVALRNQPEPMVVRKELNVEIVPDAGTKKTNRTSAKYSKVQPTTILLVEDNADLQEFIKILLPDYKVIAADNGKVALEKLSHLDESDRLNPDLIISDLMMPIMDGFEFLEKFKSDDRWRHIPVIMLTAKVNIKVKLNALRIGVDDYLTKPFVEEELVARIENLLRNYQERMQYFRENGHDELEQEKEIKPVMAQVDAEWLEKVENIIAKNLSSAKFKLDLVAFELHLSQRQVTRRIKQLTGLSAQRYLQEMRLHQAREHLIHGKFATVKEVSFAVGYRNTKYFSKQFQERFGVTPSSYSR